MMPFYLLSSPPRTALSFWTLLLCMTGIVIIVSAIMNRQYKYAGISLLPLFAALFFRQVDHDVYLASLNADIGRSFMKYGALPWALWPIALTGVTAGFVWLAVNCIREEKEHITLSAIRFCYDNIPGGICYWKDSGHVLFSNTCMNALCRELTNVPLLNGSVFRQSVTDEIMTIGDKVWKFEFRDILLEKEILHEMVASDISELYEKTIRLQKNNEELAEMAKVLKDYNESIEELVRNEEILQTKISIHDDMNRLMLMTEALDPADDEATDEIFRMWERNTLLLCTEANSSSSDDEHGQLIRLAGALGMQLIFDNSMLRFLNDKQRELFFITAREAVLNAAKHGRAGKMEITIEKGEEETVCCFKNDGLVPGEIRFAGGLANLEHLAGRYHARLEAKQGSTFALCLTFSEK